jgi:antitoxin VapB
MALSIKSDRADRLARELADLTGESITDAVVVALEERLAAERRRRRSAHGVDDIVERFSRLAILDDRSADEILGYDAAGLPT